MSSSGSGGILETQKLRRSSRVRTLLSRDDIPDENQQNRLLLLRRDNDRLILSQLRPERTMIIRRSIWSLFSETFASVFSLENRMWRTWLMLMIKPGRVAREYADGKRTNWTSPVRIYLALSIILFGYMSLTETRIFSLRTDIVPRHGFAGDIQTLDDASVKLEPDFGFFRRQAELDRLNSGTDFERVIRLVDGTPRQVFEFDEDLTLFGELPSDDLLKASQSWPDETKVDPDEKTSENLRRQALETYAEKVDDLVDDYNDILFVAKNPETVGSRIVEAQEANRSFDLANEIRFGTTQETKESTRDALILLDQELQTLNLSRSDLNKLPVVTKYGFAFDISNAMLMGQPLAETEIRTLGMEILQNPAVLNEGISRYLPRIMFLMMPFAAIIGLVFIRGKNNALLYDHLVHATYIHAVTFAFLFILILISQLTPATGLNRVFLLGAAVYLPLSAKRMFQRGWFKTIFASFTIASLYAMTMFSIVAFLTARSITNAVSLS